MGWPALIVLCAALCAGAPARAGEAERTAGRAIYERGCAQCHGPDGDQLAYAGIVPLSGIGRRHRIETVGQLAGRFTGRSFTPDQRRQIAAYLVTLRGAKGYPDSGWLIPPVLLEKKLYDRGAFRILDLRGSEAYAESHIPNALPAAIPESDEALEQWLGSLGVTPETTVVVYDDRGGRVAAAAWWRILEAGHPRAIVLDGGWRRWLSEARPASVVRPPIPAEVYSAPALPQRDPVPAPVRTLEWSAQDGAMLVAEEGFPPEHMLVALMRRLELAPGEAVRIQSPEAEVPLLLLAMKLLGWQPSWDRVRNILSIHAAPDP